MCFGQRRLKLNNYLMFIYSETKDGSVEKNISTPMYGGGRLVLWASFSSLF